jgi:acyl carrier protein
MVRFTHPTAAEPYILCDGELAMTAAEIRQAVLEILADIAPDEDLGNLKEDVPFREQLELDSMDFLDIVMELRKRYRIQIPEEEYSELVSMGSTVRYLEPRMKEM